jgi:hypothetical protein
LELAFLAGLSDPLFDVSNRIEILVQLTLIREADLLSEIASIGQHRIQYALIATLHAVFEKSIERQRGIEL